MIGVHSRVRVTNCTTMLASSPVGWTIYCLQLLVICKYRMDFLVWINRNYLQALYTPLFKLRLIASLCNKNELYLPGNEKMTSIKKICTWSPFLPGDYESLKWPIILKLHVKSVAFWWYSYIECNKKQSQFSRPLFSFSWISISHLIFLALNLLKGVCCVMNIFQIFG